MRTHAIRFDHIRHSETNAGAYPHTIVGAAPHHGSSCVSSLFSPTVLLRLSIVGILPLALLGLIVLVLPYTSEALS